MEDKFPIGISINKPSEKAPEWVKARLGINVERATKWLEEVKNSGGYVNIDVKLSKKGELYLQLNDWKPKSDENISG